MESLQIFRNLIPMQVIIEIHVYLLSKIKQIHALFTNNTFAKITKSQVKAKQHPEAELSLFENYLLFSSSLSSKNNTKYSKKCTKIKYVCLNEVIRLMAMKMRLKMKNRSHIYDINRTRLRHGHEYTKYKMCLSIIMVICIKQHLSKI